MINIIEKKIIIKKKRVMPKKLANCVEKAKTINKNMEIVLFPGRFPKDLVAIPHHTQS